jgi:hypothetical protein
MATMEPQKNTQGGSENITPLEIQDVALHEKTHIEQELDIQKRTNHSFLPAKKDATKFHKKLHDRNTGTHTTSHFRENTHKGKIPILKVVKQSPAKQLGSMSNTKQMKPSYFDSANSYWEAFIATLLIGLLVFLIGTLTKNAIVLIVSQVILLISGVFFFLAIMLGLLCLLTLGLIC